MAAQRAPDQQYWLIEPLLDAGLGLDEIRTLVFDLGFQAIVSEDSGTVADVLDVVRDQPLAVRLAWQAMIGRMLDLDEPAGSAAPRAGGSGGPLPRTGARTGSVSFGRCGRPRPRP